MRRRVETLIEATDETFFELRKAGDDFWRGHENALFSVLKNGERGTCDTCFETGSV
jgi:hypothetical protein